MKKFLTVLMTVLISTQAFAQKEVVKGVTIFGVEISHGALSLVGTISTWSPELAGKEHEKWVKSVGWGLIVLGMVLESGYVKAATPEQKNYVQNLNFEAKMAAKNPELAGNTTIGFAAKQFDFLGKLSDEEKIKKFASIMLGVSEKSEKLKALGITKVSDADVVALLQGEVTDKNIEAVKNRLYLDGIVVESSDVGNVLSGRGEGTKEVGDRHKKEVNPVETTGE